MENRTQIAATSEGSYPLYIKPRRIRREQIAAARAKVQKANERARQRRLNRRRLWPTPPA